MQFEASVSMQEAQAAGIVGKHSHRYSRVLLDLDTLRTAVELRGDHDGSADDIGTRSKAPTIGQTVEIEPFENERYRLRGRHVEAADDGQWTWVGDVLGYEHGDAVLTIDGNSLYGTLRVDDVIHEFRTGSNGVTYVREPDPAGYGFESHCAVGRRDFRSDITALGHHEGRQSNPLPAYGVRGSGSSTIDVMVLYSPAAASRYNVATLANNSAASMNASFAASNVDASVRIVHYGLVSGFDEATGVAHTQLQGLTLDMVLGNSPFNDVPGLRNTHEADLALFIYDGSTASGACGYGLIPPTLWGDEYSAYSMTGDECIASFNNFAHEIGHTLGGRHDYHLDPTDSPYPYSHGHSSYSPDFMTIMGSDDCSMTSCSRLNRWSNPLQSYMSTPLGVPMSTPPGWGEDMTRSLNNMNPVIASYRSPSASAPSAPSSVTVERMLCYGSNLVYWATASGTIGWYEVETSTSSSFTWPSLVYRGPQQLLSLWVGEATYVRGRSCNSNHCSSWQVAPITATYTPGCI